MQLKEKSVMDLTGSTFFQRVNEVLESIDWLKEARECLDYANPSWKEEEIDLTLLCDYDVEAVVTPGGSEGIYVSPCLIRKNERIHLGTYKTLGEDILHYSYMGQLAGAFTYIASMLCMMAEA